jgi:UDP-hydrolysing UDP-N-acetyl-D-glucosamine 2-epimerase
VRWLLHDLSRNPKVDLQVIALGPHLSPAFGHTGKSVAKVVAGTRPFHIEELECLLDSDTDVGMAKTIGVAMLGFADMLGRLRPDILVLIADRYEMLASAAAALALRIPMAHIEGGEITVGAIDDAVRNALTKMAHLHFACTRKAAERIKDMGEEPWRITFSGSLSLDTLRRKRLLSASEIQKQLGFAVNRETVTCVYHPVTMLDNTVEEADELFAALGSLPNDIIFLYPNADAGSRELIRRSEDFVPNNQRARVLVNLDHLAYLSLLKHSGALIGNSSSGIIECTSLGLPAVNIGIRQRGREHATNVIDVAAKRNAIRDGLKKALTPQFRTSIQGLESPYGQGNAAEIISNVLVNAPLGAELLFKHAELL